MAAATGTVRPFHRELEERTLTLWEAIDAQPFLRELGEGTLEPSRFAFFLAQDVLYLDQFARVLACGAARAEDPETRELFLRHAGGAAAAEQRLHAELLPRVGLDLHQARQQEPAPVTLAYTDHLLRVAHGGSLAELVAAVLPCYWVYARVGERLARRLPDHELYRTWILTYASADFHRSVGEQLQLADRLAAAAGPETRERMHRAFRRSLRYEWMFWDQAYRLLDWPV